MSSWDPPPNMNVVSPAHYTSPMGGSLYTRTWREGENEEYGNHVFENHKKQKNNNRSVNMQNYQNQREMFRNAQQGKRMVPSDNRNNFGGNIYDNEDDDDEMGWGPPLSPKNRNGQNQFFSPKHSATSPNYKQKVHENVKQRNPSNKHNDAAKLEIEKLRRELEIKSQEMNKMKEETKLENASLKFHRLLV